MGGIEYIAIFFSFIIGLIFGGMAAFLSRRMVFNRQLRIAERKAARMVAEARNESKGILQEARRKPRKTRLPPIRSTVNEGASCNDRKTD